MARIYDIRQKEVINIRDGCRFGFAADLEIDEVSGKVSKIIVPGVGRILGLFGRDQEYLIPWDRIKQMGEDVILVDVDSDKVLKDCEY